MNRRYILLFLIWSFGLGYISYMNADFTFVNRKVNPKEPVRVWADDGSFDIIVSSFGEGEKVGTWNPPASGGVIHWEFVNTYIKWQYKFPANTRAIYLYGDAVGYYRGLSSKLITVKW